MDAPSSTEAPSNDPDTQRETTLRLVLLVGRALPLDGARRAMLQRKGLRCIVLPGLQEAVTASRAAHLDAIVIDAGERRPAAAPLLVQLQLSARRCPVIVIGRPRAELDDLDELDELAALACGASAYLVEPVPPERLLAHLRAQLRLSTRPSTAGPSAAQRPPIPGNWRLDMLRRCLYRPGRIVELSDVQLALLQCLFDAGHHVVSRGRLSDALMARRELEGRTVDVYVHRLRRHLAQEGVTEFDIRGVRSQGYRLVATRAAAEEPVSS